MSAIWGCVDLSGGALPENLNALMERPLHEYRIDRYASISTGNVAMGCGVQYITAEAEQEPLPIYDEEERLYFTADCIVDNRAELIGKLTVSIPDIPDGELMFLAYKKWRDDMPKHVRGAYSYAAYDARNNRLTVGADHVSSRCINYYRQGPVVYFSTITESILACLPIRPEIDKQWLCGYLGDITLGTAVDPDTTPYSGIKKVLSATYMFFTAESEGRCKYWDHSHIKPLRPGSDKEYAQLIARELEEAARELTRTSGEVAILLSGGMDSSTVASFCAPVLEEQGKHLYAFTSIPIEEYSKDVNRGLRRDESGAVKEFCLMYPNIIPHFDAFSEDNAFSVMPGLIRHYEMPMKSSPNINWITRFIGMASDKGCRIMLTGQFGNISLTMGSAEMYAATMVGRLRLVSAFQVLNGYALGIRYSRRRFFSSFAGSLVPLWIRSLRIRDYFEKSLISPGFVKSLGINRRDKRFAGNSGVFSQGTFKSERRSIDNTSQFSELGEIETKAGLRCGLVLRDLTRHVKILELCLSLPLECFVNPDGTDRRIVREYLKDRFPDGMHDLIQPRGHQSADWVERLVPLWNDLYPRLYETLTGPILKEYVDGAKLRDILARAGESPLAVTVVDMIQLASLYGLVCFLRDDGDKRDVREVYQ